jgi:hypothetical protein
MTTQNTTTVEIRDNAYWPDEAQLAEYAELGDRMEQTDRPVENDFEYAALFFGS